MAQGQTNFYTARFALLVFALLILFWFAYSTYSPNLH